MTKVQSGKSVKRETAALVRGRALVIEIGTHGLVIRFKGARRGFAVDYESILWLGARKEAERKRVERRAGRNKKAR